MGDGLLAKVEVAFDEQLKRQVVIKTLTEPAARDFFVREVHDLAKIAKHPNIVSIYGAWLDDKPPHYVRQFIDGHSLSDELAGANQEPLRIDFVHLLLAALGDAMKYASRLGVWNLGIRPEKVLIEKMAPQADVDLSDSYNIVICPEIGASEFARNALVKAAPQEKSIYFPPEYFRGFRIHSNDFDRANQYRLGIIGYQMLVGCKLFRIEAKKAIGEVGQQ